MTKLKKIRLSLGMTQSDLAEKVNCPVQNISALETGQRKFVQLTLRRALRFADALGIEDIRELVDDEEIDNKDDKNLEKIKKKINTLEKDLEKAHKEYESYQS